MLSIYRTIVQLAYDPADVVVVAGHDWRVIQSD